MRAGVLQLSRWGVLPDLVAAGTPAIRSTTFHYGDGGTTQVSICARARAWTRSTPRAATCSTGCWSRPPLRRGPTSFTRHPWWGCCVTTTAASAVSACRGTPDGEVPIRAALTVGADGIGSLVAREVGAPCLSRGRAASAVLYRYVAGLPLDGLRLGVRRTEPPPA